MALLDMQVAMLANMAINYLASGNPPKRWGNAHPNIVPYQTFRCTPTATSSSRSATTASTRAFCRVIGREDLVTDPAFATGPQRLRNRKDLIPLIAEAMRAKTMDEWVPLLEAKNVPCGPIYNMKQVFEDPQVRHREMQVSLPHSAGVQAPSVANPIRLSARRSSTRSLPPCWENTTTPCCRSAWACRPSVSPSCRPRAWSEPRPPISPIQP